jgi:PAP2 superfamily
VSTTEDRAPRSPADRAVRDRVAPDRAPGGTPRAPAGPPGAHPVPAGRGPERPLWHPLVVLPELVWMLVLVFGYSLARLFVVDPATGYRNAFHLWALERDLHLPSETAVQHLALHWPEVLHAASDYYAYAHFPVTSVFLAWVYVFRHRSWRWVRNGITGFTAAALLIEALLPMAPPRLVPAFGMEDVAARLGESVYPASTSSGVANQFAAMPSVHFGWALLVGVGVVLLTRWRWRWLALLHPGITLAVITLTANHYWLDSVVAGGLVAAALGGSAVLRRRELARRDARIAAWAAPVSGR